MTISEYVECEADVDAVVRFAGSMGEVDLEYTPTPERMICAADQHYATRAEVNALRAEVEQLRTDMADVLYRLRHCEGLVHRYINRSPGSAGNGEAQP